nr:hypothetical protein [Tern adenovirus]
MEMATALVLYYLLAAGIHAAHFTDDEWIPFTPKNYSCLGQDFGPNLIASYCTREKNYEKGIDKQTCLPIEFWMTVCNSNPSSANEALVEALNHDDHDKKLIETPWHETCYMYSTTWPICVSKEDKYKYCKLWRSLSPMERRTIRSLSKISIS